MGMRNHYYDQELHDCEDCVYFPHCAQYAYDGYGCVDFKNSSNYLQVVLCMECKHVKFDRCNGEYMCDHSYGGMVNVEARSFCSYGERENDG